MRVIGLTGGIASGKSHVARFFEAAGTPVIHSDQLAREVVLPGTPSFERVREAFPDVFWMTGPWTEKLSEKESFLHRGIEKNWNRFCIRPSVNCSCKSLVNWKKKSSGGL